MMTKLAYVVAGTGGTGGILAAYLAAHGGNVTCLARGAHLAALQENGLKLERGKRPDLLVNPIKACTMEDYQGHPDIVFVCVKYYSLSAVADLLNRVADERTLVIPILNVFGTGAVLQDLAPHPVILDGCIYIYGLPVRPGVIAQPSPILRLFYGFRPKQCENAVAARMASRAAALAKILCQAGIEAHFSPAIETEALTKFSFVSPLGAAGLYCHAAAGAFQLPGKEQDLFLALVREVIQLGQALHIQLPDQLPEHNLKLLAAFPADLHTSMQRDVAKGGKSEFAGLVKRVVSLGHAYSLDLPAYEEIARWGKTHLLPTD